MNNRKAIKQQLSNLLSNACRIGVLGIGYELAGDDAAGMIAARYLQKLLSKKESTKISGNESGRIKVFFGAEMPENCSGDIRKFNPSHLILIDCSDAGEDIGDIRFISLQDAGGGASFTTHRLPLEIFLNYLFPDKNCEIIIIGIKPGTLDFASSPSKEVASSARFVAKTILEAGERQS